MAGVGAKEFLSGGNARAAFLEGPSADLDAVNGLEEGLWDAPRDEGCGSRVLTQLVDWENTIAD